MKKKDRSLFSKRRKDESPAVETMTFAPETRPAAPDTVRVGQSLLFAGAPEAMPIVDDQLYLYMGPQGGLAIGPQFTGAPMMSIWREGENWLARRLCQGSLLCNGAETWGDSPVLLQDGVRMELVGVCAFTFQEIREPAPAAEPVEEEQPSFNFDEEPASASEPAVMPIPATEPGAVAEPAAEEKSDIDAELTMTEEAPFDWTPFFPADEPEDISVPVLEPEVTPEPVPVTEPETAEIPVSVTDPEIILEPVPVAEPEPVAGSALMENADLAAMLAQTEEAPFEWKPFDFAGEVEIVPDPVHEMGPEIIPETFPVTEPVTEEKPPFDWTLFFPADEPEVIPGPVPEPVPGPIPEPVPVAGPEVIVEPVPMEEPVFEELPVPTAEDPLVLAFERLAAGDREALQELPGLLAQKELYCWGGFNFLGVYLQPIPAVRPADWSGDTDALDQLGWEPRPGMVIPVFTCEEEAVKRECPLGAFPSASAPDLFAHFAETGLDLELDPFGAHPVKISAAAVREISQILGGSPGKFRWIRRTLPW